MLRFVFWNVGRKSLQHLTATLARETKADLVALAECTKPDHVLHELVASGLDSYRRHSAPGARVEVFSRLSGSSVRLLESYLGLTLWILELRDQHSLLLGTAHLRSKLWSNSLDQEYEVRRYSEMIREHEDRLGHRRTVIVGDLNMNPFEPGMIIPDMFHAVSSRTVARRKPRTKRGQEFHRFYNPMWGFLGDRELPPGTFFHSRAKESEFYWNMYDQVLLRPDLITYLPADGVGIITSIEGKSLLTVKDGRPNKRLASDHLPVAVTLDLPEPDHAS